jgi:hypothetical protein
MIKKTQYNILRTDLFPTIKDLEILLTIYSTNGLDVEVEIAKLIDSGYIAVAK